MSDKSCDTFPYVDRDLSWMHFNHRILQEARREDVPLLERLSFLGIYSNNLDEFFRVRMASISRLACMQAKDKEMKIHREKARKLFCRLAEIDSSLADEYNIAIDEVREKLSQNGIHIVDENQIDENQKHFIKCRFREKISGFISPVWLSKFTGFSRESDDRIYLAVVLDGPSKKREFAVIDLPSDKCGRFMMLPDRNGEQYVIYLDDVIRLALPMIFPGMEFTDFKAYSFKFTKDAEFEIDNDLHMGPLEKISKAVKSRKKGAALRVLHDADIPSDLLDILISKLKLDRLDTVKASGRYQNHKDFISFPENCRPDMKYPAWKPIIRQELKRDDSLLSLIADKDRFIHVPYHSFDYVIRMLQEAAVSKNVKSIKITLYRLAKDSKVVEALICAARNGKKVTAVVELLARFNESSNIHYAKRMQDAGINVVFGVEGLKIHSKIIHIGMKCGRNIALVGTGNFHEGNARVYTDYFYMTSRNAIVKDVDAVFGFIKRPFRQPAFKSLLVSPINMRQKFIRLIDDEAEAARKGKEAWIKIKINHITDPEMVEKLYEAARAGVRIDLLVRGNCSLSPSLADGTANIRIIGIIDRYLEHSRIFIFHAGGKMKTYIGSADWMPRNLDNRVEVIAPIEDKIIKEDLLNTVTEGITDNTHGRIVDGSGSNIIPFPADGDIRRSQERLYDKYLLESLSTSNSNN